MLALASCCSLFLMLPCHVALFSFIYTIFSVACFHGALLPSSFFYNSLFLQIKLPPCCIFFHVVFFSCHTFNFFSSFSPCWSFFMLYYFHIQLCYVVPFSYCISNSLHCSLHTFLTFSLIFCCLFSCDSFFMLSPCCNFFMWHFLMLRFLHVSFVCCLHYVSFSCLYSFHVKLFSDYTVLCCIFSCFFLPYDFFHVWNQFILDSSILLHYCYVFIHLMSHSFR